MNDVTFLEAIKIALREEMERDPSVFVIGEDIGAFGGAFKVTAGLLEQFGADRVVDTPISESAIIGAAVGAALMGHRPIAEMQFADFITCGFNQIVNMAGKLHYRFEIPVPMVVRAPSGAGTHGGPFHTQSPEGWFCHVPGVKVVVPATPADARGLLKAAIRDDNPVIYFEHKNLYRRIKGPLPGGDGLVPLGVADVKRPGKDLSIITYGMMVHVALEASDILSREDGVECEVVDLRTLMPYDQEAIVRSVQKTSRAMILYEDVHSAGIGSEIAAFIGEALYDDIDSPVLRISPPDTSIPFADALEKAYLPQAGDVVAAVRELAAVV